MQPAIETVIIPKSKPGAVNDFRTYTEPTFQETARLAKSDRNLYNKFIAISERRSDLNGHYTKGTKLIHDYGFGSTTERLITVMGETVREKGRRGVRLLARNVPPEFICGECGVAAEWIDPERVYTEDDPFLCNKCAEKFGDEMLLPVVNSPAWASAAIVGIRTGSLLSSQRARALGQGNDILREKP